MPVNRKVYLNTATSLLLQVTTVVCGFILPRLILTHFGSAVNGLIGSINQFLGFITFLEMGVGGVVQANLYKPIADHDEDKISAIVTSADKFFRHLALIILAFAIGMLLLYPLLVIDEFDYLYTATLIAAIAISMFAQYYFGVVNQIFLDADQHGYVHFILETVTLVLNTIAAAIIINLDGSIQLVKFASSCIYLLRPWLLYIYVKERYHIDRHFKYEEEPIRQKWNGVAQHLAAIINDSTDAMVLTVLSTLQNVSIYSVYNLVVSGVRAIVVAATRGMGTYLGQLWATRSEDLKGIFEYFEWLLHTVVCLVCGCTLVLIVPFVSVYTRSITDANYHQPLFAVLVTLVCTLYCVKLPYSQMINAAGHYKQTQHLYIYAAIINMGISLATARSLGLIGIAMGSLIAMAFQCLAEESYCSAHFVVRPTYDFVKRMLVNALTLVLGYALTFGIALGDLTYAAWVLMAIKVLLIWLVVALGVNVLLYRQYTLRLLSKLLSKLRR